MNNDFNNYQKQQYYQQQNAQYMMKRQVEFAKKEQRKEIIKAGFVLGGSIVLYVFLQSFWAGMLAAFGLSDVYQNSVMFKYAYNIIGVDLLALFPAFGIGALILKKNFKGEELFPAKKIGVLKGTAWVFFGMGCTVVANYLVSVMMEFVKNVLGYELTQNDYGTSNDALTYFVMFVATAIAPAIFEEFAFRCCALGSLKKYGKGFAVFMVSIVFGLIHGNVIQFVFAFLVGLILAYITVQTDNVIIAMIIHALNNSRSAVNDILTGAVNEKTANTVAVAIMLVISLLAIVSLIYLLMTKSFAREKKPKSIYDNNFATKLACMIPGMIIPFAIMFALTKQYITKV